MVICMTRPRSSTALPQALRPIRRFDLLDASRAPGQQPIASGANLNTFVDFSHGDVGAFPPPPAALEAVAAAMIDGSRWAYSPYRGHPGVRAALAARLEKLTGEHIDPARELMISAGTQASLFLALSALVERGDRIAVAAPDYFAYRKIAWYLEAQPVDVPVNYRDSNSPAELDLVALRSAMRSGARIFVFSNPNNPTGAVYEREHLEEICAIVAEFDGFVVVDQLYCRQIFDDRQYTHLRSLDSVARNSLTLMGPSKTESLSGLRLGVAFGSGMLIDRMESLQGLTTLRAPGYAQAALSTWLLEDEGWMRERVSAHAAIRDELVTIINRSQRVSARTPEGSSYIFVHCPALAGKLDGGVERLRRDAGVIVTRGDEFGEFGDAIRLNFSQNHSAAVAAMDRIVHVLEVL